MFGKKAQKKMIQKKPKPKPEYFIYITLKSGSILIVEPYKSKEAAMKRIKKIMSGKHKNLITDNGYTRISEIASMSYHKKQ